MIICSIEGVYKAFEHKKVLENLNLELEEGKFTCLVGASGCGKTTLVNLIAGHEFPDRGKILFRGEPVRGPYDDRLIVFQETALFEWLNLWENTIWGPLSRIKGKMPDEVLDRTAQWIEKVGLKGFEDKFPLQLSGGMQRRAELIRGLVNEPSLLLLDEPFRGLDAMTRELMQEYVTELFEEMERISFLFITSDIQEAIFMSDMIYFMSTSPAKITKKMAIDLPRPRKLEITTRQEFFRYKSEAIDVLYSEANVEKGGWEIAKKLREAL
ncbi:MAG: ABC transporter ATP-binding protein [Pseudomonadota bacterium]